MDYHYPPEAEEFRLEVREWIEKNLDQELTTIINRGDISGDDLEKLHVWNRKMAEAQYVAISWPKEFGGREAPIMNQVVLAEEMSRANAPMPLNPIGLANIAPSIMSFGTEEQKQKYLKPMLCGDDIWCQGFSEPDAGSDLASLRCKAVLEGDEFVINGQKVWNTLGHYAQYCELLVRTDPDAKKHAGISCLLIDMNTAGIDVKPITTMTGAQEFAEIFFEDVRVPKSALLGELNKGWTVAMSTLSNERAGVANLHLMVRKKIANLIKTAKEKTVDGKPLTDNPLVRQKLAHTYLYGELQKSLANVSLAAAANGEPPGAEGSIIKICWTEVEDMISDASASVLGVDANTGDLGENRLYTRSTSIAGGTTQVNKNIVAQRVLGLPRA